jgi:hypothetical protein
VSFCSLLPACSLHFLHWYFRGRSSGPKLVLRTCDRSSLSQQLLLQLITPHTKRRVALHFVPFHFVPGHFVPVISSPHTFRPRSFRPRSFRPRSFSPLELNPQKFMPRERDLFKTEKFHIHTHQKLLQASYYMTNDSWYVM